MSNINEVMEAYDNFRCLKDNLVGDLTAMKMNYYEAFEAGNFRVDSKIYSLIDSELRDMGDWIDCIRDTKSTDLIASRETIFDAYDHIKENAEILDRLL